jgi:phosphoribosylformylglycinamidine synthase
MDVDVAAVPRREDGMAPFEVMTSESQERMLAIVTPDGLDEVLRLCARWEVQATVIGRVTSGGRLRILDGFDGEVLADVPASSLHDAAPLYDRPRAAPADRAARAAADPGAPEAADCTAVVRDGLCDTSWVYRQYDHQLFLNTVEAPGGDAALLRLKHPTTGADTGRGLALTTDGNHLWCAVDPRLGTAATVAESVLNLACVGARPVAVVNCLNFGNPEHPEVMWQLSEAIDGMAEACRALGLPIVGGNVSLYNETAGVDIDPTPVIGLLGVVDALDRRPPGVTLVDGHHVLLAGAPPEGSLAGSAWAAAAGLRGGTLDPLDLMAVTRLAGLVRELVAGGLLSGVHDVAAGGLGGALAEMAVRSGVGATVAGVDGPRALLAEAPGRALLGVSPDDLPAVRAAADAAGVPLAELGRAGGDRLTVDGLVDLALAEATAAWRDRLPAALDAPVTSA